MTVVDEQRARLAAVWEHDDALLERRADRASPPSSDASTRRVGVAFDP